MQHLDNVPHAASVGHHSLTSHYALGLSEHLDKLLPPMEMCCQASRYDGGLKDPVPVTSSPLDMISIPWKPETPEHTHQHLFQQGEEGEAIVTSLLCDNFHP